LQPPCYRPSTSFHTLAGASIDLLKARSGGGLHEESNPSHRLRVEHDAYTMLIHLSDEDGSSWTTIAVDRATRSFAVVHGRTQSDTARRAYKSLYSAVTPSARKRPRV